MLASTCKHKRQLLVWNDEASEAFERIKAELASSTMLVHPDHEALLSLVVDASKVAMGAVLRQYSNAAYSAIRHFNTQLKGRQFQLISDNEAL